MIILSKITPTLEDNASLSFASSSSRYITVSGLDVSFASGFFQHSPLTCVFFNSNRTVASPSSTVSLAAELDVPLVHLYQRDPTHPPLHGYKWRTTTHLEQVLARTRCMSWWKGKWFPSKISILPIMPQIYLHSRYPTRKSEKHQWCQPR